MEPKYTGKHVIAEYHAKKKEKQNKMNGVIPNPKGKALKSKIK